MDDFKFACPTCGQHMQAGLELLGKNVNCPECNCLIKVSNPDTNAGNIHESKQVTMGEDIKPPTPKRLRSKLLKVISLIILAVGVYIFISYLQAEQRSAEYKKEQDLDNKRRKEDYREAMTRSRLGLSAKRLDSIYGKPLKVEGYTTNNNSDKLSFAVNKNALVRFYSKGKLQIEAAMFDDKCEAFTYSTVISGGNKLTRDDHINLLRKVFDSSFWSVDYLAEMENKDYNYYECLNPKGAVDFAHGYIKESNAKGFQIPGHTYNGVTKVIVTVVSKDFLERVNGAIKFEKKAKVREEKRKTAEQRESMKQAIQDI